jgi:hypothetical protein
MIMIPEPYKSVHGDCGPGNSHKKRVLASDRVGCFYCVTIFPASEIKEWTSDECALCPYCGIDSVLPDSPNLTLEFLREMEKHWFGSGFDFGGNIR